MKARAIVYLLALAVCLGLATKGRASSWTPGPGTGASGPGGVSYNNALTVVVSDVDLNGGGQIVYRLIHETARGAVWSTTNAAYRAGVEAAEAIAARGVWDSGTFYPPSRIVRVRVDVGTFQP